MLTVYKVAPIGVSDVEKFFDQHISYFDLNKDDILKKIGNSEYVGHGYVKTPYGLTRVKDISTVMKLAVCLVQAPAEFFPMCVQSVLDTVRILNLPDGNLVLPKDWKFQTNAPIKVRTITGNVIEDTKSLSNYLSSVEV